MTVGAAGAFVFCLVPGRMLTLLLLLYCLVAHFNGTVAVLLSNSGVAVTQSMLKNALDPSAARLKEQRCHGLGRCILRCRC